MGDKPKILLVEDDPSYAELVKIMLARAKDTAFDVDWKSSLGDALDRLSIEEFDLVLLDMNLPDSGGIDTFVKLHAQEPYVPIMLLTGTNDETIAFKAVQMGAQDYLVKGEVNSKYLVRSILYSIERHRAQMKEQMQDLQAKENNLRNVIERNADGIIILDKDGIVLYANPSAEVLFARPKDELMGEVLGFPVVISDKIQISILNKSRGNIIVEMRVVKIKWDGRTAYLATLRDITDHKRNEEKLRNLSLTDDLTGLYNRRGFLTLAEQYLKSIDGSDEKFLIVFFDMDGLKQINDTLGHDEGSRALVELGEILRSIFSSSDTIARLGGDEFVVLVKDTSADQIDLIKKLVHKKIEEHNTENKRPYKLSLSMGAVCGDPRETCSIEELLTRADELMYLNKQGKESRSSEHFSSPGLANTRTK